MKFPRCIRLDSSDLQVFALAAEPGEWAVPGSFCFFDEDPEGMDNKRKLAFKHGWLGTESFGHSSLVEVAEIEEGAFTDVVERLARHFVETYGAPSIGEALPAAREEADYTASLCEYKAHTLLSVERGLSESGEIVERFRVITPQRAQDHARIWEIVPDDDEPQEGDERG